MKLDYWPDNLTWTAVIILISGNEIKKAIFTRSLTALSHSSAIKCNYN